MANTYFQFKQFVIDQDKCAMKVCTDSCIFGASLPINLPTGKKITNALDIGAGTGLLSLMYAQQNIIANIDAIEIEPNAYQQANENINESKFASKINLALGNFFNFESKKQYDLIFSNPPFYNNDLVSGNVEKDIAHHSAQFNFSTFLQNTKAILDENGMMALLLPTVKQLQIVKEIEKQNWYIHKITHIYHNESKRPFRQIYYLTKTVTGKSEEELIIKQEDNYSPAFALLLQNYYLQF